MMDLFVLKNKRKFLKSRRKKGKTYCMKDLMVNILQEIEMGPQQVSIALDSRREMESRHDHNTEAIPARTGCEAPGRENHPRSQGRSRSARAAPMRGAATNRRYAGSTVAAPWTAQ